MFNFTVGKFNVRLLNKDDKNELCKVQSLRYEHLLRDFNPSLPSGGLDDDGVDSSCDSIIVIDTTNDRIVGTYRLATKKTKAGVPFLTEHEFDVSSLLNEDGEILELGRAVVDREYRDGTVINLLWSSIFEYCKQHGCNYMFGTCSLHGHDPKVHDKVLAYLKQDYVFEKYKIVAKSNAFEYPDIAIDNEEVKKEVPPLLKAYLGLGGKVSYNGYIDYDFNSCDVLMILYVSSLDSRHIDFFTRKLHKG